MAPFTKLLLGCALVLAVAIYFVTHKGLRRNGSTSAISSDSEPEIAIDSYPDEYLEEERRKQAEAEEERRLEAQAERESGAVPEDVSNSSSSPEPR